MAWTPLKDRIDKLPLILAGPILRRVERDTVTVWVALKKRCAVSLTVWEWNRGGLGDTKLLSARTTIKLGEHLHVVAVTAVRPPGLTPLEWGKLYCYNLVFDPPLAPGTGPDLFGPEVLVAEKDPVKAKAAAMERLTYNSTATPDAPTLPSFALPPEDLNKLRIIHGSCRRFEGEGQDALQALDAMIKQSIGHPDRPRPHQLFLTGDQIYADCQAEALLAALTDVGDTLLGGPETLPDVAPDMEKYLKAGKRRKLTEELAGFSHGYFPESHLLTLGEYYSAYLFAWSDVLWPPELPEFADVYKAESEERKAVSEAGQPVSGGSPIPPFESLFAEFNERRRSVQDLREPLHHVRRALANIPTYMMFDDHEVTNDWYLNLDWSVRVLEKPLGRRVLQNGLLAMAVFQAWGNTPDRFDGSSLGRDLLKRAENWSSPGGFTEADSDAITKSLGLPESEDVFSWRQLRPPPPLAPVSLDWHYTVKGHSYEVIVLDTRTWRSFPGPAHTAPTQDPPALIADEGFDKQIGQAPQTNADSVTIVIAPTTVIGVPLVERLQYTTSTLGYNNASLGDQWIGQTSAFELLLAKLALRRGVAVGNTRLARVVVLCGDIHYSYAVRLQYWADQPFGETSPITTEAVFAQLTCSALKNESFLTRQLHTRGYKVSTDKRPDPGLWGGWNIPPDESKVHIGWIPQDSSRPYAYYAQYKPWMLRERPAMIPLANFPVGSEIKPPEWRYRFDFIPVKKTQPFTPETLPAPTTPQSPEWWIALEKRAAEAHKVQALERGVGKQIVGLNNIGEINFHWGNGDDKNVSQVVWWWLSKDTQFMPLSTYTVSLKFNDTEFPKPTVPVV